MKKRILSIILAVIVVFLLLPTTALADGGDSYEISVEDQQSLKGGSVTVASTAIMDENVTFTVSMDSGYQLGRLVVSAKGRPVNYEDNHNGTYTFTMPDAAVIILVTFESTHTHDFTYTANDNKLIATCTSGCYAGYDSNPLTLTLTVPSSLVYDGNNHEATITDTDDKWDLTFAGLPNIEYGYKEFGMEAVSYSSVTDTKDAGYYKASITAGDKTAYVEYQIAKQPVSISVTMADYKVNTSQPSYPSVSGGPDGAMYNFKFKKKGADDSTYSEDIPKTPWGDYTVKATYAGDKNHESATATCDFKITPKERTGIIKTIMPGYVYGTTTVPTPSTDPVASELEENPSVMYKYRVLGSTDEWIDWTGDSSALDVLSDTGKYEMIAVIGATATYAERQSSSVRFTVTKGEWKVASPIAKTGLTYNCAEQELVNAGIVEDGGTLLYSLDAAGSFGDSIPQATDAGEYTVYYKVESDDNHYEYQCDAPIEVTIAKADWNVTAPTAVNPSVTGDALELVNAGVVKDADNSTVTDKLLYSLNGTDYSTAIPTAIEVGSYTVYYKVAGDDNHNEYTAKTMTATIEKISRPDTPTVSMEGYTYGQTGSIPSPSLSATPSEEPTVTYYYNSTNSFDGASEWKNITATTLNAGTYYMFAKLSETTSYRSCNTEGAEFTVAKATCTVTAPTGKTLKYNGQAQGLVNAGSVTGGTMLYSLDDETYSLTVPTGINRGDYPVYYKVLGDGNHKDIAAQTVTATIGMGEHAVTAPRTLNPTYNGTEQVLISAGSCTSGTILYSLDGMAYTASISEIRGTEIDSYIVYYKVEGDSNYDAYGPKQITAKIVEAPVYSSYEDALNDMLDAAMASGSVKTIEWNEGDALPGTIMKKLCDNPSVSLEFAFTYEEKEHTIFIPAGAIKEYYKPDISWYGPEWLIKYFEKPEETVTEYTIAKGDNLNAIAKRHNCTVKEILALNPSITNPNRIVCGKKLIIPVQTNVKKTETDKIEYIISKGDTLNAIAKRYNCTVKEILALNPHITNPNRIFIKSKLWVPTRK